MRSPIDGEEEATTLAEREEKGCRLIVYSRRQSKRGAIATPFLAHARGSLKIANSWSRHFSRVLPIVFKNYAIRCALIGVTACTRTTTCLTDHTEISALQAAFKALSYMYPK
ncbi:hypothetical protein TcWFU_001827 [Taenia crassiceps]|uniref:Uncharacterized protein n=1 Tax=Taenia crassiceps TaxID=6207 RepID=A0ABR4QK73_9CEST